MLQLHLGNQQVSCILRYDLYKRFYGSTCVIIVIVVCHDNSDGYGHDDE